MLQVDIRSIYNDIYQLKRLPGESPCDGTTAERVCQSILGVCEGGPPVRARACPIARAARPHQYPKVHPPPKSKPRTHVLHKHIKPESYQEALVMERCTLPGTHSHAPPGGSHQMIGLTGLLGMIPVTDDPAATDVHAVGDAYTVTSAQTPMRGLCLLATKKWSQQWQAARGTL